MADNTMQELTLIREKFSPSYNALFELEKWAEKEFDSYAHHCAFQARVKLTEFENLVRFKLENRRINPAAAPSVEQKVGE